MTPVAKTFKQKNFNNFVWTPLGSRVNLYINFCIQVHFKLSAAWYCCHYLPPVSTTVSLIPVANLPPVSLIPVAICHRRRWHRWQICHRYQERWRKWWKNLPRVSLIPVVHLDSRISLNGILWSWGHWYRRQFCRWCRWHRLQICHWCRWPCTLTREYPRI